MLCYSLLLALGRYGDIVVSCIASLFRILSHITFFYVFLFCLFFFAFFVFAGLLTMYLLLASQPIYPSDVSKSWILLEK